MELFVAGLLVLTIFAFTLAMRYIAYREKLALADRGILEQRSANGHGTLRGGIMITFVGIALMAGLYPIGWLVGDPYPLRFGPWMLIGLGPTAVGLAMLLTYILTRRDEEARDASPSAVVDAGGSSDYDAEPPA